MHYPRFRLLVSSLGGIGSWASRSHSGLSLYACSETVILRQNAFLLKLTSHYNPHAFSYIFTVRRLQPGHLRVFDQSEHFFVRVCLSSNHKTKMIRSPSCLSCLQSCCDWLKTLEWPRLLSSCKPLWNFVKAIMFFCKIVVTVNSIYMFSRNYEIRSIAIRKNSSQYFKHF